MTEAVAAVIDWAFETHPDLQRIKTTVIPENEASCRVLEKCGMELLGEIEETWDKFPDPVRLAVYGLTRPRWAQHGS